MLGVVSAVCWQKDTRMAALEALLSEEQERHCQHQRSTVGHVPETERRSRSLCGKQEDTLHLPWVKSQRLERRTDDPMDVEWKGTKFLPQERGKNSTGTGKVKEAGKDRKDVCDIIRMSETHRKLKVSVGVWENRSPIPGLLGEPWQMATATESRTFKFSWKGKTMCEGKSGEGGGKERQFQRCWSTCLESAHRLHRRRKQTQRLVRLTRFECTALDLCATTMAQQEGRESSLDSLQCGHSSWRNCVCR